MEVIALPYPLRTKTNQEVPSAVQDRLAYLWRASSCALNSRIEGESVDPLETISASSHRLSKSFIEAARVHKVDLPLQVTERLCGYCSVMLIPSVTCQIRLRPRSRRSKVNKTGSKDKLKNQLVMRCNLCSNVWKAPGFIKKIKEAPLHSTNSSIKSGPSENSSSKSLPSKVLDKPVVAPAKSKFSFLNKLQSSSSSSTASQMRGLPAPTKTDSKDFMSFSGGPKASALTQSNSSSLQALSRGLFGGQAASAPPAAGALNLLELEALNKKKKRKSMGGGASL